MSALVRVVTLPDPMLPIYYRHPHEGMIICRDHLRQIVHDADPTVEEIPAAQVAFLGHRCLMCGIEPSPGRRCENEDCRQPLHPQWPAVYCCTSCALADV